MPYGSAFASSARNFKMRRVRTEERREMRAESCKCSRERLRGMSSLSTTPWKRERREKKGRRVSTEKRERKRNEDIKRNKVREMKR